MSRRTPSTRRGAYRIGGVRSLLGVPIRTDDGLIGAFGLGRLEVNPFTDDEVALVTIFADQAAIAIRIARLLSESHEAVERESAVREVLQTIAPRRLRPHRRPAGDHRHRHPAHPRADDGNIIREDAGSFGLAVFTAGVPDSFREIIGSRRFGPERGSAMGRALMELQPIQIVDVLADPEYTLLEAQREIGFRTILAIPLINEGTPIGVLSVWRTRVDPFRTPRFGSWRRSPSRPR